MFDATILRVPGQILQENPDGSITNLYRIKVVNKSSNTQAYSISLQDKNAILERVGKTLDSLKSGIESEETFFIKKEKKDIHERKEKLILEIKSGDEVIQTKKVTFIGKY
jgi:uncharacterized protein YwgA